MFSPLSEFHLFENNSHYFTTLFVELFLETTPLSPNLFNAKHTYDHATTGFETCSLFIDFEPLPSSSSNTRPTRICQPLPHLRDYHCYSAIVSLHEPFFYIKASKNPFWKLAMIASLSEDSHLELC